MSDNPVLALPRAIRGDIANMSGRLDEHGHRFSRIEMMVAGQRREQASDAEAAAHMGVLTPHLADGPTDV